MSDTKKIDPAETEMAAQYGTAEDDKKHPKGQKPTQSQDNGQPKPQPGTEDLPKNL